MTSSNAPQSPDLGTTQLPSISPATTIPKAASDSESEAAELELRPQPLSQSPELEWPFLLNEQRYLLESTRFADQKAGFAFAFALGSLAFLHHEKVFDGLSHARWTWALAHPIPSLAGLLLVISAGVLLAAVLPRLWWSSEHELSLVFWEDVIQLKTSARYLEAVRRAHDDGLRKEVADHCFTLARICDRKFSYVNAGMWVGAVGAVLGLFTLP